MGGILILICNAQRRVSTRPSHAPASSRHVECTCSLIPIIPKPSRHGPTRRPPPSPGEHGHGCRNSAWGLRKSSRPVEEPAAGDAAGRQGLFSTQDPPRLLQAAALRALLPSTLTPARLATPAHTRAHVGDVRWPVATLFVGPSARHPAVCWLQALTTLAPDPHHTPAERPAPMRFHASFTPGHTRPPHTRTHPALHHTCTHTHPGLYPSWAGRRPPLKPGRRQYPRRVSAALYVPQRRRASGRSPP
jgi:hypothetical protein